MARSKSIIPAIRLNIAISPLLKDRLKERLWSCLEGCVPRGAYQTFIELALKEYLDACTLDLSPFSGSMPGEMQIRGDEKTLEWLEDVLKGEYK